MTFRSFRAAPVGCDAQILRHYFIKNTLSRAIFGSRPRAFWSFDRVFLAVAIVSVLYFGGHVLSAFWDGRL